MERNVYEELDELKDDISDIKAMLSAFCTKFPACEGEADESPKRIHTMKNVHPDIRVSSLMADLCAAADQQNGTGLITTMGVFASGGRQRNWIRYQVPTDRLLALIENGLALKVLACVGNEDRLRMLLALLKQGMTVSQLVEQCGYTSTGQVYHHLRPLIAANLVMEDSNSRGSYIVVDHRVHGLIHILAGVNDMIDPEYTQGDWENAGA